MRNALFFLSLTMSISLRGLLRSWMGVLLAIALFLSTLVWVILQKDKGVLQFFSAILIGVVLLFGVAGLPFSHALLVSSTLLTIFLILTYSARSKEDEIAPVVSIFIAIILFLYTFAHLSIPVRVCWDILIFLTAASMIDDWNVKYRSTNEREDEQCFSE